MANHKFKFQDNEVSYYKKLISNRFLKNPRMSLLFNKNKKNFAKNVYNLVDYCFNIAIKTNGVYVAKNKKTLVLFYEKKKFKRNTNDFVRYLKVIKGIPFSNLIRVLKDEGKINAQKIKLKNYLYVWFIAQEEDYSGLDGLIEINHMLFSLSNKLNLPILFETSDSKLLKFYEYAGFRVYNTFKNNNETTYFLTDKRTYLKYKDGLVTNEKSSSV